MHQGTETQNPFTSNTTLDDVADNPTKFGAPTLEEFARNPDKWRQRKDHLFAAADNGTQLDGLKKRLGKTYWEIDGYRMDSIEKVERYCKDEGLDIQKDVDLQPFLKEGTSGKIDIVIRFARAKQDDQP